MDKNAIKKYAVWARRELIERVTQRAYLYGITADDAGDPLADSVRGRLLSETEKKQRAALIARVRSRGFAQVMEEAAYTWFNRFAALRFLEANAYLPSHIRVFTDEAGEFKPQILTEAIHLEWEGLDIGRVYELEGANRSEELFKYLLISQCSALNAVLPGMFQKIADYTELLFPDNQLRPGSVIEQLVSVIPEEDWKDQVQIIGWLYESYNTELNAVVYDGSLSKSRIAKELLPAATTIYTPDWPVRYMVENSLGRIAVSRRLAEMDFAGEAERAAEEKRLAEEFGWKYYLAEAEQTPEVRRELNAQSAELPSDPQEIRVIDPCMGSGHILCVFFDVLVQIYEAYGYTAREAARKIAEHNLWGLDIDDRAAQLAYFAVMMKARQYDRRFLALNVQPHVCAVRESSGVNRAHLRWLGQGLSEEERRRGEAEMLSLLDEFVDAKEYGSILRPKEYDWELLRRWVEGCSAAAASEGAAARQLDLEAEGLEDTRARLRQIIVQGQALAQQYHVVVTNPPYLGSGRFSPKLDSHVKANWPLVKADLSMVMYQHALDDLVLANGFVSFITTSSWMFLSSFEKLRAYAEKCATIFSLVDFGTELFEGKVGHNPIVSWVVNKSRIPSFKMTAVRLVDYCYSRRDEKESEFFSERNRYTALQDNFAKIPGAPLAYWVGEAFIAIFLSDMLGEIAKPRQGLATGCNDLFIRLWYEVENSIIKFDVQSIYDVAASGYKWFPYNKGGEFRKWYGNNDYVVNWENDGFLIKNFKDANGKLRSRPQNTQFYFRKCISWSLVSSGTISFRYKPYGHIFDVAGMSCFADHHLEYLLGLCNSSVTNAVLAVLAPTINYQVGDIANIPVILDDRLEPEIEKLVNENINYSKTDWDAFETSWDFQRHPLARSVPTVAEAFALWEQECAERFRRLKANEEELNRIFIDIYGLQDELTPEVEDKDVTVRRADLQRDVRSLISYAVGCMLGRYSLDEPGLAFAGGDWDPGKYTTYRPDEDGILPITDDDYFQDDIVTMFADWVRTVYGADTLEENLNFIARALTGEKAAVKPAREVIRGYFLNDFFADHCRIYQKRPIYWLFDSGKKNGFKCLIYLHRYRPDTVARIRTDYVHGQQSRCRTAIAAAEQRLNGASPSERVKLNRQLAKLQGQAEELLAYEEKVHHLADQMIKLDLDDGVKVNYAKLQDVLGKIK